jgi:tRNA (guanine26-N2/guanine27-N2)-dimethyltransferase
MTIEREYTEGRITFLSADVEYYSGNKKQITASLPVFYNARMRLNRDISVLFLSAYLRDNKIETMCEPLTGSGVRTLRYLKECPGEFAAKLFDVNPNAIEIARKNIKSLNLEKRAQVIKGDAKILLLTESREKRFDCVDVDPFGTPAPYLNAAVQSLNPDGALLAITATDMPVLCGGYQKVALRRYGGISVRAPFVHEIAVRLLEGFAFQVAGLNDCSITPLAVLSTDHYIRTWIKIEADRKKSNRQTENLGVIKFCEGCMQTQTIPQLLTPDENAFEHAIPNCRGPIRVAGPLWIGDLFKAKQLKDAQEIFNQEDANYFHKRVPRILDEMIEENVLVDIPYVDLHALCDLHNLTPPKNADIIEDLKSVGYNVSRTHFRPTAIRTNAPIAEVVSGIKNLMKRRE